MSPGKAAAVATAIKSAARIAQVSLLVIAVFKHEWLLALLALIGGIEEVKIIVE